MSRVPLLRVLILCFVVVGVLAKPVLVFASDMHTVKHILMTGEDGHGDHGTPSDPIDPKDAQDPWHALLHLSECCGHAVALLPDIEPASLAPIGAIALPPHSFELTPTTRIAPYRPPIRI